MGEALIACRDYYTDHVDAEGNIDDAAFTAFIRKELRDKADDVRVYIRRDTFRE
jgi:hypothetical protein